jgi:hypothetical protein
MTTTNARTRRAPAKGTTTVVPADVKRPEDRKPKAEEVELTPEEEEMAAIEALAATAVVEDVIEDGEVVGWSVDLNGFTIEVPQEARDDFELSDDLRRMQDGRDLTFFPSVLRRLSGEDGFRTAMNGLRNKKGRVTHDVGVRYVNAVLISLKGRLNPDGD